MMAEKMLIQFKTSCSHSTNRQILIKDLQGKVQAKAYSDQGVQIDIQWKKKKMIKTKPNLI